MVFGFFEVLKIEDSELVFLVIEIWNKKNLINGIFWGKKVNFLVILICYWITLW